MNLSARQVLMLRLLLKFGKMDIETLSQKMEVSERTIFREVSSINEYFQKKQIRISMKKSILTVDGTKKDIEKLQYLLLEIPGRFLLTPKQRTLFIASQLLLADDVCKSAFFSYQLGITEGAVSMLMNHIEQWLRGKGLTLHRKRGYGIAVDGTEWTKRNALVTLIYEYKPIDQLLAFFYGVQDDQVLQYFFNSQFGKHTLQTAKAILDLVPQKQTDDIIYLTSLLHTMISVKKMLAGCPISLPEDFVRKVWSLESHDFCVKLQEFLKQQGLPANDYEIAYIAVHLPANYRLEANRRFQGLNVTVDSLAKEVLEEVQAVLKNEVAHDSHLLTSVSQDLGLAIYRADMGIHIKNSLLKQVQEHYGVLFQAVDRACKLVFSKYNLQFSPDEIGVITMEIGSALETKSYIERSISILIVCPNGLFASHILYNKLKNIARVNDSITIASLKEWSAAPRMYDLIISTVSIQLDNRNNSTVLVVSQFLSDDDIARIHKSIDQIRSQVGNTSLQWLPSPQPFKAPYGVLEKKLIDDMFCQLTLRTIPIGTFTDMIQKISEELSQNGIVSKPEEIVRLILQREKTGSVVIPGTHVSLLHVRSDLVSTPFVGVYRLQGETIMRGIGFAREPVDTFLIMLARSKESPVILEKMGNISVALIEDQEFTEILRTGSFEEIKKKFMKILAE